MGRRVQIYYLQTRKARSSLGRHHEPRWWPVEPRFHIGYRRAKGEIGTWYARFRDGSVYRKKTLGLADDREDADGARVLDFGQAVEAARAWKETVARTDQTKVNSALTVGDALDDYLRAKATAKGIVDTKKRIEALIRRELGDTLLSELTADRIRRWRDELANRPARIRSKAGTEQKYKPFDPSDPEQVRRRQASVNRTLAILKAALNHAFDEGRVESSTAWDRVKPFSGADVARVRYLSVAEARRLINAADVDFRKLVRAALATGARYGELARLTVGDFNADSGTVHVRTTKRGKDRHVVLTDEGRALFGTLAIGRAKNAPMLTKANGSTWGASHQLRPMAEACERARISPPTGFHVLRHTWASLSVMNSMPLMVVAKNLGHADTRMVEHHYGHLARGISRSRSANTRRGLAAKAQGRARWSISPRGGADGTAALYKLHTDRRFRDH